MIFFKKNGDLNRLDGDNPVYVSDELMAISQIQTNESAYTMNHTGFYGVAENLSWGYKSYDPYEAGTMMSLKTVLMGVERQVIMKPSSVHTITLLVLQFPIMGIFPELMVKYLPIKAWVPTQN